ncbi:TIGR03668 family PPOX class F420-dependent oxidoreductase [Actinomycetes bacterium KLBMP 9797]
MDDAEARERFASARVAVLATVDDGGAPHAVPVVFALAGDTLWTATDAKAKRGAALRRHANIRARPRVTLLAQHWDEDWSALWWVRADGLAVVTDDPPAVARAVRALRAKYAQYRSVDVGAPVIEVTIETWHGWHASS